VEPEVSSQNQPIPSQQLVSNHPVYNAGMEYPLEWDELPRHERRKKIKALRRERAKKPKLIKKILVIGVVILIGAALVWGFVQTNQQTSPQLASSSTASPTSPEGSATDQPAPEVSLEDKVEQFPIEGRNHVPANTEVTYQTNPPTSGSHLAFPQSWGVYDQEIDDKAAVHAMEHGGIWITYTSLDESSVKALEEIWRSNPGSVIVSPRAANEDSIAVASWGRVMRLAAVDQALIQQYIDTFKNQSPERLAR